MEFQLLAIILDTILTGIIISYLIWDHIKDDRSLTKKVQEFYDDIECLIFYYYLNIYFSIPLP